MMSGGATIAAMEISTLPAGATPAGWASLADSTAIRLVDLDVVALEMPLGNAIRTPMAVVSNAVTLLVRARDCDGVEGWGEAWCQFPRFGMFHRARILREVFRPLALAGGFDSPQAMYTHLSAATRIMRLQAGENGPFEAVLAGIDIAAWDIVGKKAGQPLWRMLGGGEGRVRVYASIGRAESTPERIAQCLASGIDAIKLRSTGDAHAHLAVAGPVRERFGYGFELMLDINSSWDAQDAIANVGRLAEMRLAWMEEPVPVDTPPAIWHELSRRAPMPLAGGENMMAQSSFDAALELGALRVLQPDITKLGGFSASMPLARRIVDAGRRLCPHMFAGAPGILASAHLLAASRAPRGLLEWPVNHNPARDAMLAAPLVAGCLELGDGAGLGFRADTTAIDRFRIDI